tara:strand:- start:1202 stop:1588 length:387 start_codon:yes stop_codon:yes gene_type:complete
MTAPNIVNVSTITAKTNFITLADTNANAVISNPASSNKVMKINTLFVANDDGSNSATIDLIMHDKDGGPTDSPTKSIEIAKTVTIPAGSTAVILDKNSALYLEEDHSIYATASVANDLNVFVSYEEIS